MAFVLRKPPSFMGKTEAFPYQLDALRAIQDLPYAAVFHEQGLGKTKIALDLTLFWLTKDIVDTVFIVTKKSLVHNWREEAQVHCHIKPSILSQKRRENSMLLNSPVLLYVMNYEVLTANEELLKLFLQTCRVSVILDEAHKIKNPDSKITKVFLQMAPSFERRIIMTGTPVANRPYDIWSQINFLDGGKALGDSFDQFKRQTDLPDMKNDDADEKYSDILSGIFNSIKHFAIRETKQSSGIELPSKTIREHKTSLAPRQGEIYRQYRDEFVYKIDDILLDTINNILKGLLRLVQCASNPFIFDEKYDEIPCKFIELQKLVDTITMQNEKVIVWTSFIKNADWLASQLKHYGVAKIHGKKTMDERHHAVQKFKGDKNCQILIATPGSAKEGLTLTVANHAIFYDRSFSLDDYLQAQDRIHRISQEQHCFVYNLIADQTIDLWTARLLKAKHQAAQLAQGDQNQKEFDESFDFDVKSDLKEFLKIDSEKIF